MVNSSRGKRRKGKNPSYVEGRGPVGVRGTTSPKLLPFDLMPRTTIGTRKTNVLRLTLVKRGLGVKPSRLFTPVLGSRTGHESV